MEWVDLPHGRVRVVVEGPEDGPTVLMIHGLSYPLEAWGPVSRVLAEQGVRTIRSDLYGRGFSGWDGTPLSSAVMAEQQRAVLDHVGVDSPVQVISLSNADLIALWLAAAHPERVRELAFVGPSGFDARTMNRPTRWMGSAMFRHGMGWWMRHRLVQRMGRHAAHIPASATPDCAEAYASSMEAARTHPPFGMAVVSHLSSLPSREELGRTLEMIAVSTVTVRALHFGAEEDATPTGVEVLARHLTTMHSQTLMDCGHMGMLERPNAIGVWWLRQPLSRS